jgi:SAM-dependent methyltransferase
LVNSGVSYTLLDPRPRSPQADVRVLRGIAEDMPVAGNSIGLIMSVSMTQYVEHDAFFLEARRVLAPNGILALHENGCCNPIISVVRVAGRVASLWNTSRRDYNRTIKGYLKADQCPSGFTLIYSDAAGLLAPIATLIGLLGFFRCSRALERLLIGFDDWALQWAWLRKLAWFRVYHFRLEADSGERGNDDAVTAAASWQPGR